MSEIKQINLYGTNHKIKDEIARNSISKIENNVDTNAKNIILNSENIATNKLEIASNKLNIDSLTRQIESITDLDIEYFSDTTTISFVKQEEN